MSMSLAMRGGRAARSAQLAEFALRSVAGPSRLLRPRSISTARTLVPALTSSNTSLRPSLLAPSPRLVSNDLPRTNVVSRRSSSTATAASQPASHASPTFHSDTQSRSGSNSSHSSQSPPEPEPEAKSAYARFKALSKKYGWWALGMYTALSSVDFSLTFLTVHAVGAERIEPAFYAALHRYHVIRYGEEEAVRIEEESRVEKAEQQAREEEEMRGLTEEERRRKKNGGGWGSRTFWAEVALAYAIHKTALLPFRAGLTVAWTPKLVNWLTKRGWVGKGGITRAATHAQGKIKDARERVKDASDRVREAVKK
ncbi:hypothetical protein JCM24511_09013 [Saitozyma sp. JCM 24511]|nr:hypothetical protein JCM24511_09013 [Saitozyma sp. JCM 24511]